MSKNTLSSERKCYFCGRTDEVEKDLYYVKLVPQLQIKSFCKIMKVLLKSKPCTLINYDVLLYRMTKYCKHCKTKFSNDRVFCSKCKKVLYPCTSVRERKKILPSYTSVIECTIFTSDYYNSMALGNKIFIFGTYQSHKERNPYFDDFSERILDIKGFSEDDFDIDSEKFLEIIGLFLTKFEFVLNLSTEYTICVIPSHKEGLQDSGIRILGDCLADASLISDYFMCPEDIDSSLIIDGTSVLVRTNTIEKKTKGGRRDFDYEKASLSVQNTDLIKDKQVLLLDDVTTTGTSLKAGKQVLLEAGAKTVVPFALGETWKYKMFGIELDEL